MSQIIDFAAALQAREDASSRPFIWDRLHVTLAPAPKPTPSVLELRRRPSLTVERGMSA